MRKVVMSWILAWIMFLFVAEGYTSTHTTPITDSGRHIGNSPNAELSTTLFVTDVGHIATTPTDDITGWQKPFWDTTKENEVAPTMDLTNIMDILNGINCTVRPDWPGPQFNFDFKCDVLQPSDEIPTSVHRLQPSDIKVISALGDSLTAANGAMACSLLDLKTEYRGRTFSHGGDLEFEKNPSLANILRKYNPDLKGYGKSIGVWDTVNAGMNVGKPGAEARHTMKQARNLVDKMKLDTSIDYEKDWKLVTLFIGGNDICAWCGDTELYHPDMYVEYIRQTLTILHDEMPRTFFNVVSPLQVDAVLVLGGLKGSFCDIVFNIYQACPCMSNVNETEVKKIQQTTDAYQRQLQELINSGYFDDKEDFTVVLQPFMEKSVIPELEDGSPDSTYLAPDCFHWSLKGHAAAGQELWNNMFERVGEKRRNWAVDGPLTCPTKEFPFIYTNINSGLYDAPVATDPPVPPTNTAAEPLTDSATTFSSSLTSAMVAILAQFINLILQNYLN